MGDVPIVWEALGESVIGAEGKGDFARADELLQRASSGPEAELARGVVALLAGLPGAAVARLEALRREGSDLRSRAAAYLGLALQARCNTFPGGAGGGATEISARWDPGSGIDDAAVAGDAAALDEQSLIGALCSLQPARMIVEYAAARLDAAEVDRHLDGAVATLAPLRERPSWRGYGHLAAADLAHRAGRPDSAHRHLRAAWAAYEDAGDHAGVGACHLARGDWQAAPASTPQARNLTLIASGAVSSALDWTLESVEGSRAGLDVDAAATAYADAERAFEAAGAPRGLAAATVRRAHLAAVAGDHAQAQELSAAAGAAFRLCGDRWGAWLAAVHEEIAAIGAGRLAGGTSTVEAVGAWGRVEGSFSYALGLGLLLSRAGRDWLRRQADAERALAAHRLARALFASLRALTDEAQSVVDRGQVLQALGEVDGAAAAFEEAFDLLDADDRPAVVDHNRQRAIMLAQQLCTVHLTARDAAGLARSGERLRRSVGRLPPDAGPDTLDGLVKASAADTLAHVGVLEDVYRAEDERDAGHDAQAERHLAAALETAQALEAPAADFLEAVVLAHWRRYDEASTAFRRSLAHRADDGSAAALQQLGPADHDLQQQQRHEEIAAFFRRLRDYPAAIRHFEALEELGGPEWWRRLDRPWEPLSDFGVACEQTGRLARALELHERAIEELHTRRARLRRDELRTTLSGTVGAAPVHFAAARTALRLSEEAAATGDDEKARSLAVRSFWYAEQGRARSLLDLLATSAALASAPQQQSAAVRAWHQANAELSLRWGLLAAERSAQGVDPERLAALHAEVREAEEELRRREADLDGADRAFASTVTDRSDVWGVDEVGAVLEPDEVLLAYQYLDEDLLGWAVSADGLVATHRAAIDGDALSRQIRAFTDACARGGSNWDLRGEELVPVFLAPFAAVLERCQRLIIVPSGAAHAMPFHALPWRGGVLGAQHAVAYLPSATSLQFLTAAEDAGQAPLLAVGNPTNMRWQPLPSIAAAPAETLPAAETEARFIAALFDGSTLLVGFDASEAAVRAALPGHRVVHLATHGQLSSELPLLSCLLLADGEALSVYELMGIGLDADVVVLSACESGRGAATSGGDVLGLSRALLAAGARRLVVTLWHADDVATCVLMADFYRRVRDGVPYGTALAQAQDHVRRMSADEERAEFTAISAAAHDPAGSPELLQLRTEPAPDGTPRTRDRHPSYWAPFILVGR
jgi:CHAT domain-containing protein